MQETERTIIKKERSILNDVTNNALKVLMGVAGVALLGLSALDVYADGTFDGLGLFGDGHPFLPDTPEEEEWAAQLD